MAEPEVSVEKNMVKCDFGEKPPAGIRFRWSDSGDGELYWDAATCELSKRTVPVEARDQLGSGQCTYRGNYVIVEFKKNSDELVKKYFLP